METIFIRGFVYIAKKKKFMCILIRKNGKVLCQLGGCAMSHPLNFPQFHSAGVSRDRFDMRSRIFSAVTSPQVLRVLYIITDVISTRRVERCVIEDIW